MSTSDWLSLGGLLLMLLATVSSALLLWHKLDKKTDILELATRSMSARVNEVKLQVDGNAREARTAHAELTNATRDGFRQVHGRMDGLHKMFSQHLLAEDKIKRGDN